MALDYLLLLHYLISDCKKKLKFNFHRRNFSSDKVIYNSDKINEVIRHFYLKRF